MFPRFDGTTTPGTSRELIRCADAPAQILVAPSLLDRFDSVVRAVRSGAASHPQTDAKRRLAPAFVAMFKSLATNRLARANHGRRSLELLNREEPQCVAHQHRYAFIGFSPSNRSLQ